MRRHSWGLAVPTSHFHLVRNHSRGSAARSPGRALIDEIRKHLHEDHVQLISIPEARLSLTSMVSSGPPALSG